MLKDKIPREECNRIYKCLPNEEYPQLKLYVHGLVIVLDSAYLCEKIF